jgi:hypothetical protein
VNCIERFEVLGWRILRGHVGLELWFRMGIVGFENLKARKPVRERPAGSLHASLYIYNWLLVLEI